MVRLAHITCFTLALLALSAIAVAAATDVQQRFTKDWSAREAAAVDAESRKALAADLLQAAEQTLDKPYRILLCEKAVEHGRLHTSGYASAARALHLLQRTAPDRRLWCLELLRELYDSAYRRRPAKLRLGTGLADVLEEMAEQRVQEIDEQFEVGKATVATTLAQYNKAMADLGKASSTLDRVIKRALSDAARVNRSHPQIAGRLRDFADEFKPHLAQMTQRQLELTGKQRIISKLLAAERRFTLRPSPPAAQALAALYIVQWDRPEAVGDKVAKHLPDSMRQPLRLAVSDPNELTGPQADMLARWYAGIASQNKAEQRQQMLIRARVYRELADDQDHTPTAHTLAQINDQLRASGIDQDVAAQRALALERRLIYQFGSTSTALADPTDTTLDDPVDPRVTPKPGPNPADTTQRPDASDKPAAATSDRYGGRPMVNCDKCGRRFFPGWDAKTTRCTRCKSGGSDIFDFGKD